MSTERESPWPWHNWAADGEDADTQCTCCLKTFPEEEIEPIVDAMGGQQYACPDCYIDLKNEKDDSCLE